MSFSLLLRREIRNDKGKGGDSSRGSGVEDAAAAAAAAAADADEADDDDDDDGGEGEVMRIKSGQNLSSKEVECCPAANNINLVGGS